MDPRRWPEVEACFHAARALPRDDQRAYMKQLARDSSEIANQVAALLAVDDTGDARIAMVVANAARAMTAASDPVAIGPYRVLSTVGEGGLSTVYLGERADRAYRARVAIKVIKRGMDTHEFQRRLALERQILASLKHPHIATLLDGGTTETGQAFFVLEYIEGWPVDVYCDRHRLTIDQRLELFRSICGAVDYAHRNLVIHRDIKPSNVLVSADGTPKLLDFGIAKLLTSEFEGLAALETVTGLHLMTPEYASPEQIDGQVLTTGTDVYSLGVLLYRLLTGMSPYRLPDGRRRTAVEAAVRSQTPQPPSVACLENPSSPEAPEAIAHARRTTIPGLRRRLSGDLDNIVLMALRKEPARRYPSAEQLAADIEHHLHARPVSARPDTWAYRTTTFVRRHTATVAVTGALVLALIGGIVATTAASLRAQRHLAEAKEVSRFLTHLFQTPNPARAQGRQVTARELLDEGARRIGGELDAHPAVRHQLLTTMGLAYHGLGEHGPASELLEAVLAERRTALGDDHPLVAASLRDLSRVRMTDGDYDQARALLDDALTIERQRATRDTPEIAETLDLLAGVARHEHQLERAESLHRQALAIRRSLLASGDPAIEESRHNLAETLFSRHALDEAETLFRAVLDQRRARLGSTHPDVALTLNDLAVVLQARGATEEAEAAIREVVTIRRTLYGEDHGLVAQSYANLAEILRARGRHGEAVTWLEDALTISRRQLGDDHPYVALFTKNLGLALQAAGQLDEAEKRFRESLAMRRARWGDVHPEVAQSLYLLAALHAEQGREGDALRANRDAMDIQRATLPQDAFPRTFPLALQGRLLAERGDCEDAKPILREAEAIRREHLPEGHSRIVEVAHALALCDAK